MCASQRALSRASSACSSKTKRIGAVTFARFIRRQTQENKQIFNPQSETPPSWAKVGSSFFDYIMPSVVTWVVQIPGFASGLGIQYPLKLVLLHLLYLSGFARVIGTVNERLLR